MTEHDRTASRVAELLSERGPDPVPVQPEGFAVTPDEWRAAWRSVLLLGLRITCSNAHADDIRQEAYTRLATTRPWRRDAQPSFVKHMLGVAASVLKHDQKAHARRTHHETEAGAEYRRERGDTASPEEDMLEHAEGMRRKDHAARVLEELRRRLAGYPLELRLIDRIAQAQDRNDEDSETPAELAKALGVNIGQIYRAIERIKRYKASVRAAVGGTGEEKE